MMIASRCVNHCIKNNTVSIRWQEGSGAIHGVYVVLLSMGAGITSVQYGGLIYFSAVDEKLVFARYVDETGFKASEQIAAACPYCSGRLIKVIVAIRETAPAVRGKSKG